MLARGLTVARPMMADPLSEIPIVAFDFDGTLTVRDSFSAFLKWRAGPGRWAAGCAKLFPDGAAYLFHRNRGRMKAAAVREFLAGAPREQLEKEAKAFANYASKPPFSSLHPEVLRLYVDHGFADLPDGSVTLKCAPEDESEVYAHGLSHGAFAALGDVRCPTTIAVGRVDAPPAVFAAPIAGALADGRLESFEDLGHFGPLEDPTRMAAAVLDAFGGID